MEKFSWFCMVRNYWNPSLFILVYILQPHLPQTCCFSLALMAIWFCLKDKDISSFFLYEHVACSEK